MIDPSGKVLRGAFDRDGNVLGGDVIATLQDNGDILWVSGYISRKEKAKEQATEQPQRQETVQ